MLKKILGSVTPAVALAVSLVFAGCFLDEIPSDISLTETISAIGAPSNVRADAYPGVIAVTWDPAKDAKSYDVYRRTLKKANGDQPADYSSRYIDTVAQGTSLILLDIVSFDNQLQDGWEYEYTIVANSGQSTNKSAVARAIDDDDVVLNASAKSNSVPANIPDRTVEGTAAAPGTKYAKKPENVFVEGYNSLAYDSTGTLLVSWDKYPGYQYELTYRYKGPDGEYTTATALPNGSYGNNGLNSTLEPLGYYKFPNLTFNSYAANQPDKIEIRAIFPTDYYLPSAPAEKEFTAPDGLRSAYTPNYIDFVATIVTAGVELSWNAQSDAVSYTVWKAEIRSERDSTIISEWEQVTGTQSDYYQNVSSVTTPWKRLTDNSTTPGKSYLYYLIITGPHDGKVTASTSMTIPLDSRLVEFTISGPIVYTIQTNSIGDVQSLEVAWPAVEGVTYNLYQSTAISLKNPNLLAGGTDEDNIESVSWSTTPTPINSANYSYKRIDTDLYAFKNVTGLNLRQNYAYKVVATKTVDETTVQASNSLIKIVDVAPYVTYSQLSLSYIPSGAIDYHAYSNELWISDSSNYIRDAYVQIWRRRSDLTAGENFSKIGGVSGSSIAGGYRYVDDDFTSTERGYQYEYKAVLSKDATAAAPVYQNASNSNITDNDCVPGMPIFTPSLGSGGSFFGRNIPVNVIGSNLGGYPRTIYVRVTDSDGRIMEIGSVSLSGTHTSDSLSIPSTMSSGNALAEWTYTPSISSSWSLPIMGYIFP